MLNGVFVLGSFGFFCEFVMLRRGLYVWCFFCWFVVFEGDIVVGCGSVDWFLRVGCEGESCGSYVRVLWVVG